MERFFPAFTHGTTPAAIRGFFQEQGRTECYATGDVIIPADPVLRRVKADLPLYALTLEHVLSSMSSLYRTLMFQLSLNLPQRLAYFLHFYAPSLGLEPDADGFMTVPLSLTHERLGEVINASRVTTTLLLNHLGRMGVMEQTRQALRYPARFTEPDFILDELSKKQWAALRAK